MNQQPEQPPTPNVRRAAIPVQKAGHDSSDTRGARRASSSPIPTGSSSDSSLDSSVVGDPNVWLEFEFGTYVGELDPTNGLRCGRGTLTYTSGNVYDGEWRDGAANGNGEKRYTNGDVYRGGWVDGKRSGRGGYLYSQGHYFEGMYEQDVPSGYGVLTTVGGDRYAGHWCEGKKDGKGRETLRSGQVFVGHWREGKKQGRGKLFLPGASSCIFGIWNQDHFFRELTEKEMGVDGVMDVVDRFGLPTDETDPHSAAATVARLGVEPLPQEATDTATGGISQAQQGITIDNLGGRITNVLLSGVASVENRLEAFGRALERVTVGEGRTVQRESPTDRESTATRFAGTGAPPQAQQDEQDNREEALRLPVCVGDVAAQQPSAALAAEGTATMDTFLNPKLLEQPLLTSLPK